MIFYIICLIISIIVIEHIWKAKLKNSNNINDVYYNMYSLLKYMVFINYGFAFCFASLSNFIFAAVCSYYKIVLIKQREYNEHLKRYKDFMGE